MRIDINMTTPAHLDQIERRLADLDIRLTRGRRSVIERLAQGDGPKSAAELHHAIGGPLSSLYRSLSVLEAAGVLTLHHATRGFVRYELADWIRGHHHHLLCSGCGAVEDADMPASLERELRGIVRRIGSRAGFKPSDHALEIEGLCTRCR